VTDELHKLAEGATGDLLAPDLKVLAKDIPQALAALALA
jgi:hypothetical protein